MQYKRLHLVAYRPGVEEPIFSLGIEEPSPSTIPSVGDLLKTDDGNFRVLERGFSYGEDKEDEVEIELILELPTSSVYEKRGVLSV